MSQRIIIVGGGAIGLSAAWELAKRGHQVTVLERGAIGKATSWVAAGILPPANLLATDPIDRLRGHSHELFPGWAEQLQKDTGIDPGFRRCGAWYLADTIGERASMVGMTDYWSEQSIACESVSVDELVRREPAMATWVKQQKDLRAWWVPDECQIRSPHYLKALAVACRQSTVEIKTETCVNDVRSTGDTAQVETDRGTFEADVVIICSGVWTGQVAERLRLQQSLVPIRGQILQFKTNEPPFGPVVNVGHRYLVCRDDGHVLVGSCEEEVGFQLGTTLEAIESLREFALEICPSLKEAQEVGRWSGLRPMTFDGFPMIGRVPESKNLYVAAGHYRSGVHLSPATAVAMADLVTDKEPKLDLAAFQIAKQQNHQLQTE